MTQPKIALACIVKDDTEISKLRRLLETTAQYVDGIFITGTKEPQDEVKKLCKEYGAIWSWYPWDKNFSNARNFNWSQVTKDYEWILWLDTDDVLVGGVNLRKVVTDPVVTQQNVKAIFARYLYQVELDETGKVKNILIEHLRERLIRNDGTYKWVAPIHETLIPQAPAGQTDTTVFYVIHLSTGEDMEKSMYRNIEILEDEVMVNSKDPRPVYYLAKAYFDTRAAELVYERLSDEVDSPTVELLRDYLKNSGWPEERAQALEYLSMIHRERGEFSLATKALLESMHEAPQFPSVYIQMALVKTMEKDWAKAMQWIKIASNMEIPKTTLVIQPKDYKTMILECLFHIYLNTNDLEKCEKVITDLTEMLPNDMNKERLTSVRDWRDRNNLAHWTAKLAHHLQVSGQKDKLKALINAIPKEIANEPSLVNMRNEIMPPRTWDEDEIVIFCGPGYEKWSPKSISKGIGGSEEAVIYLSKQLVDLGWKVTVFADPQEDEGEYDGVKYLPYYHINWKDHFNVFVAWRQISLYDVNIYAEKTYLWNHDIQNPLTYTPERLNKIDKVMFLSRWHRKNVPSLPEEKVMYTGNGINV